MLVNYLSHRALKLRSDAALVLEMVLQSFLFLIIILLLLFFAVRGGIKDDLKRRLKFVDESKNSTLTPKAMPLTVFLAIPLSDAFYLRSRKREIFSRTDYIFRV